MRELGKKNRQRKKRIQQVHSLLDSQTLELFSRGGQEYGRNLIDLSCTSRYEPIPREYPAASRKTLWHSQLKKFLRSRCLHLALKEVRSKGWLLRITFVGSLPTLSLTPSPLSHRMTIINNCNLNHSEEESLSILGPSELVALRASSLPCPPHENDTRHDDCGNSPYWVDGSAAHYRAA